MRYLLILLLLISCIAIEEDKISQKEYNDFLIAYLYKSTQCNSQPSFFMIFPKKIDKIKFQQCLFWIIRMDCPFIDYPFICYQLWIEKPSNNGF